MPIVATWMDLEIVILSEVSQTDKDKHHMVLLVHNWEARHGDYGQQKRRTTSEALRINQGWEWATDHESCLQGESETVRSGASLGAQLLGLHLPMQETQVQSLVRELDPACHN